MMYYKVQFFVTQNSMLGFPLFVCRENQKKKLLPGATCSKHGSPNRDQNSATKMNGIMPNQFILIV